MIDGMKDLEKKLKFITSITEGILSSLELDELIYVILSGITSGKGMGFNRAFLFLLDENRRSLTCKMAVGPADRKQAHKIWEEIESLQIDLKVLLQSFRKLKKDPEAWDLTRMMSSFSLPGSKLSIHIRSIKQMLSKRASLRTLIHMSITNNISFANNKCQVFMSMGRRPQLTFRNFVLVPLVRGEEPVGAILADNLYNQRAVGEEDIKSLRSVANLATLAIERARLYERMKRFAEIDGLSGLMSRRIYEEKLERLMEESIRMGQPLSLILMDIDHFKPINDKYGHLMGDDVIRAIAGVLRLSLRSVDLSARYGGDEFAVILFKTGLESAVKVAGKISRKIKKIGLGKGNKPQLSVSCGVSCTSLGHRTPMRLTKSADRALYRAKFLGRDRVVAAEK